MLHKLNTKHYVITYYCNAKFKIVTIIKKFVRIHHSKLSIQLFCKINDSLIIKVHVRTRLKLNQPQLRI